VLPALRMIDAFVHPRLPTPFRTTKRLVGSVVLLLAISLIWPVPLSNIVPALVIALISLAYIEEDGVLLCVSVVAALVSLAFTAAIVWATIEAPSRSFGLASGHVERRAPDCSESGRAVGQSKSIGLPI
jgi:hypothetical protein